MYPTAQLRASDADRDKVQQLLNDAYAQGRITQAEWEQRASALGGPVTYSDLDRMTADLVPRPYPGPVYPPPYAQSPAAMQRTNGMAIAALACGIGQVVGGGPIAAIAAIILGHQARARIRLTGEGGDGMARAGLILGYIGLALALLLVLLVLGVMVHSPGSSSTGTGSSTGG
jgi:hypothetical protein